MCLGVGEGGTPYNGLYEEALPESGNQWIKYMKGREICVVSLIKGPKGLTDTFLCFMVLVL